MLLSSRAVLNLPEGWRFIGSPKDGVLHNNELNWHAIVVGVPPYKSIIVIDETSKTIGEIDSFDELP
jgi:hypothetical protein